MTQNLLHKKLALIPELYFQTDQQSGTWLEDIKSVNENNFLQFLIEERLASLWYDFLQNSNYSNNFSSSFKDKLKENKIIAVAESLMYNNTLKQVHNIFKSNNVPYLVFKGACLRNTVYSDPSHRSSCDIDILIKEESKIAAIQCLSNAGFVIKIKKDNVSHEVNLTKNAVTIDLHWNILRPGRTRIDLTDFMFENKIWCDNFWGSSNQSNLLVMLIHPAYTKYLESPISWTMHLIDLLMLIRQKNINYDLLIDVLTRAGIKTAAWCTLYHLDKVSGINIDTYYYLKLEPGLLKKKYIQFLIDNNLINLLFNYKHFVQIAFTLFLHDRLSDIFTFLKLLFHEKKLSSVKSNELVNINGSNKSDAIIKTKNKIMVS